MDDQNFEFVVNAVVVFTSDNGTSKSSETPTQLYFYSDLKQIVIVFKKKKIVIPAICIKENRTPQAGLIYHFSFQIPDSNFRQCTIKMTHTDDKQLIHSFLFRNAGVRNNIISNSGSIPSTSTSSTSTATDASLIPSTSTAATTTYIQETENMPTTSAAATAQFHTIFSDDDYDTSLEGPFELSPTPLPAKKPRQQLPKDEKILNKEDSDESAATTSETANIQQQHQNIEQQPQQEKQQPQQQQQDEQQPQQEEQQPQQQQLEEQQPEQQRRKRRRHHVMS
uniref:Ell-associated factor Eaf n=1 Tax=Meloidogyne hapla TaxID=6305 RepID=A0A1I8B114_MELHA